MARDAAAIVAVAPTLVAGSHVSSLGSVIVNLRTSPGYRTSAVLALPRQHRSRFHDYHMSRNAAETVMAGSAKFVRAIKPL